MSAPLTTPQLVERARARRLPAPATARAIREAANLTQGELAQALGVHWVTVSRWEAGRRRPRGEMAARYAAALHDLAEVMQ